MSLAIPNEDNLDSLHELAKTIGAAIFLNPSADATRIAETIDEEVGKLTIAGTVKELSAITNEHRHVQTVNMLFKQLQDAVPTDSDDDSLFSYHIALAAILFAHATLNVYVEQASKIYAKQAFKS